jgi:diguanylate cyclase (GGDEF)-like protein
MQTNAIAEPGSHRRLYVLVATDITDRRRIEGELRYLANYDTLTNLPNRTLLSERLSRAIVRARRQGTRMALLFLDLDRFKDVNDSLGHATGDRILRLAAQRLQEAVGAQHTVARIGGDEFTALLEDLRDPAEADACAQRVIEAFDAPLLLDDRQEIVLTPSIGISVYPDHAQVPTDMLKHADTAMYQAKAAGRGRLVRFDAQSRADATRRLRRDADFRRALRHPGELFCVYQPVFRVDDGTLSSVEALARWQHPDDGILLPSAFVPVAEATGTVAHLFGAVLEQALHEQRAWYNRTGRWIPIAVNLSPRQLEPATVEAVLAALRHAGTPADALTLELTEAGLADPSTVNAALGPLRSAGVKLAVDDFGTGYSSMARVADHRWDVVKIDHSFVSGIAHDPARRALADAMIGMAHALGMASLAEGVEDPADLAVLGSLGCEYAQGYLLAHPTDTAGILNLLPVPYPVA